MRGLIIRTLLAVTLAAGAMALLPAEEAVGKPFSGRYGISLNVDSTSDADLAVCEAEIIDLETRQVICRPELRIPIGEHETFATEVSSGGIDCSLSLSIEVDRARVSYRFEAAHDGTMVSSQQGSLQI